jgi:hypothetical protein
VPVKKPERAAETRDAEECAYKAVMTQRQSACTSILGIAGLGLLLGILTGSIVIVILWQTYSIGWNIGDQKAKGWSLKLGAFARDFE